MMSRGGFETILVDPWREHIAEIKKNGLRIETPENDFVQTIEALHVDEAQALSQRSISTAFICMKMYDTAWATELVLPFLGSDGCIVTMQNGLMEPLVAERAGPERTLGCIASTLSTHLVGPRHIVRARESGGEAYDVFRIGELDGRATPRVRQLAEILGVVDSARVSENILGERWTKLIENAMTSALSGITGLDMRTMFDDPALVDFMVRIAAEGLALGEALDYTVTAVRGLEPAIWRAAVAGDAAARAAVDGQFKRERRRIKGRNLSGIAQDIAKGRTTEIEYMNGYLEEKGRALGIPVEANSKVAELVRRLERGEIGQSRDALAS